MSRTHDTQLVSPAQRAAEDRVDAEAEAARARRRWPMRHRSLMAIIGICLVSALGAASYLWWLAQTLDDIPRVPMGVSADGGDVDRGTDILVIATNSARSDTTVVRELADDRWTPDAMPASGFFWIHLSERRPGASVVSIPPTVWVTPPGHDAAPRRLRDTFIDGGPALAVQTTESLLHVTFDHAAVFDWQGLSPLTESVDGIRVNVPERTVSTNTQTVWQEGLNYVKGERAIAYQISTYGLPVYLTAGIDRSVWQQAMLRALTDKLFMPATLGNPLRLTRIMSSLDDYVTVDDTWTSGELRDTVLQARSLAAPTVTLASLPTAGPYLHASAEAPPALSIEPTAAEQMVAAARRGRLDKFLDANPQWRTRGITATD